MSRMERFAAEIHDDPATIEADWRALEADGHLTAFQRFDWCRPWYGAVGAHGRARPLIVLVRAADGRAVMILPLCRYRRGLMRVIGFADLRVADYVAPVVSGDRRYEAADHDAMLAAALAALPACDLLRLSKMPARVGGIENPLMRLAGVARFPVSAWSVPLGGAGEVDLRLKSGGQARRKWAKAERTLAPRLRVAGVDLTVEAAFEALVAQRRVRFGALGRDDVLADPLWLEFYRRAAVGNDGRPAVELTQLELGGEVVANALGIDFAGAYHIIIPTFRIDGDWPKASPGLCLIAALMRRSMARGDRLFDLTIGDEPYKREFDAEEQPLHETTLPRSPVGRLAAAIWRFKVALRAYPRLHAALKRLAGRG
ncbi:MAG: GNAT family N-acetyltransferase [Hyphomicrobiaceae bacterium]|nr:GNAT family N-acetyltransferase [Hyphomicrobiaceae bacterium]